MILLEVFLRNTTPKTRWRVSMCGNVVQALAERISADINAALALERDEPPWMWHIGLSLAWHDVARAERVRNAYDTRKCIDDTVWMHDYHLMRITRVDAELTHILCHSGDIDVITHAVEHISDKISKEGFIYFMYAPAALITRGYIDIAITVLTLLSNSEHMLVARLAYEAACFAVYMRSGVNDNDTIVARITNAWPRDRHSDRPSAEGMKCAALCQRGDKSIINKLDGIQHASILLAAVCGGNLDIIAWRIRCTSAGLVRLSIIAISKMCKQGHIPLNAFKLLMSHWRGYRAQLADDMPAEYVDVCTDMLA